MKTERWPGLQAAIDSLCARGFLIASDDGDASLVANDVRYVYTAVFWEHIGAIEPVRWGDDGAAEEWRDKANSPAEVAEVRSRVAATWIDLGAPTAWAQREADEAVVFELFMDCQPGWLKG